MSSHSRPFSRGLLLASLLALVAAGSASAATPQQQLPTGTELGSRWHSDSSRTIDPAKSQSIPAEFRAQVTGAMSRGYSRHPKGAERQTLGLTVYVMTDANAALGYWSDLNNGFQSTLAGLHPMAFAAVGEHSVARRFPYTYSGRGRYRANEVAFVIGPVVARVFLDQRGSHYPTLAATKAAAERFAAKVTANP